MISSLQQIKTSVAETMVVAVTSVLILARPFAVRVQKGLLFTVTKRRVIQVK